MKILLSDSGQDFIIEKLTKVAYVEGRIDYVDKDKNIAVHAGYVNSIHFYEDEYVDGGRTGRAIRHSISAESVKKLYQIIKEIEKERTEEKYFNYDSF